MSQRRRAVPFDSEFFARRAASGELPSLHSVFRLAYETRLWAGDESASGPGASLDQTAAIRAAIPALLRRLRVRSLLDIPCGDHHWMSQVDLSDVDYLGADLLPELVDENRRRSGAQGREFAVLDLLASPLPRADLVLCRDCLVHLSFEDIARAVANIRRAGATHLLTTTFVDERANVDIVSGDWRPLNLQGPPFDWPRPLELVDEQCTEGGGLFADKCLGLWLVSDLPSR